jgi:hypothetical protein
MSDSTTVAAGKDEIGCVGDFNPHESFCYRKCPLSLRCIIECNRRARLEQFMDVLEFDDIGPVDLH